MRALLVVATFLGLLAPAGGQPSPGATTTAASHPTYVRAHRAVSTANPAAQAAFDDGLTLLYAFNPEEARRSFERAAAADPVLAMAYWGIATSHGVNINTSYDADGQRLGLDAIGKAAEREAGATPAERALIEAARKRFSFTGKNDADGSARAYAAAMDAAAASFPDDDDVVSLAAEAAMDARPWGYWTDDGKPQPGTTEIVRKLETVLARDPTHIGANHFLIHALEESPHPEGALDAARRLAADAFEPAAEHLAHMPAHTFMRVGDYDAAAESNVRALDDYREYLDGPHAGHESYYGHDCLFGVDALMMAGEHAKAASIAARCKTAADRYIGLVDVRFRAWSALAPYASASTFLRGMSAAVAGHAAAATSAAQALDLERQETSPIAAGVVRAAFHRARGETALEIAALESAVHAQDHLGYAEPPRWFFPVRESLGAAYYRAGRLADAEACFRADLVHNPLNPRSLFGLAATLRAEGKNAEAADVGRSFEVAWAHADVQLTMEDL